jgi:hypothetical protein
LRALLRGGTKDAIVHFSRINAGSCNSGTNDMPPHRRRFGIIESASKGLC